MRPLTYTAPAGSDHPAELGHANSALLAGGTDLVPLLNDELIEVDHLIDIKAGGGGQFGAGRGVSRADGRWTIGALTTLAELETDAQVGLGLPALAMAAASAATRQLRNRATIGGNLLQRPRCGYYRSPDVRCFMRGGADCPARSGRHEHHAIFHTAAPCIAPQPSDPASALVALDALVVVTGGDDNAAGRDEGAPHRTIPVADLFIEPTVDHRALNALGRGELITAVVVDDDGRRRSTYRKVMDRAAWAFALVGVAAAVTIEDRAVVAARLVASGVATVPWRMVAAEASLVGRPLTPAAVAEACGLAVEGAEPLAGNRYKAAMLRGLVDRTLTDLVA